MSFRSAAARAASTLRDQAERLNAGARGKPEETEKLRQAEALQRIATLVEEGAEALRSALGPAGTEHDGLTAADRERAGRELYNLAQRRAEKGMQRQVGVPAAEGWEIGGHDLPIHRATLREAAELYELALAVHYDDYWNYLRGLLHESLGDYAQAVRILEGLAGTYAAIGVQQAARCRRKIEGTFDLKAELDASMREMLGAAGANSGLAEVVRGAFATLQVRHERAKGQTFRAPPEGESAPVENLRLERAERAAREFADHLANADFAAARALLARDLRALEGDTLSDQYARMMGLIGLRDATARGAGEATVMVMTSDADMPDLGAFDLGWVYVSVTNDLVSEAVAVVVTEEDGEARIRSLEWGRP